jgi:hypothetical protein
MGELLRWYSDFRREGNFAESKLSGFCSGGIRNTQSTSGNHFFAPAVFYSRRAPRGCSALREILLQEENPGLKCTRTDVILKKFEFKMNFKLKINVKQDRTNFRSIQ